MGRNISWIGFWNWQKCYLNMVLRLAQILFELGHNGVLAPLSTIFQLYHGVKLAEMLFG